jgi:uncharacterized membrane protein
VSPEELLNYFLRLGFSKELAVLIIAASPIVELRLAIPLAINTFDFPWYYAILLAITGNLLPVPFILLFLDAITRWLSKIALLGRLLNWLFERTRRRGKIIERYKRIGLVLFVAIPLPVTGAWTGSLAAVLFGLSFRHAFLSILIGVCIAGAIVTCLSLLGWVGAVIAGVGLGILAILGLWRASR